MLINRTGNDFILEDLQSTNGTYLNGNQVTQPIIMQHGDVIQVGETILVLEISGYKSAILGFGAKPTQMVDNSQDEVTDPTRLFDQYLADLRIQK